MVEPSDHATRREALKTGLQFAVVVTIVGGWSWATWGVEVERPDTPIFGALAMFAALASIASLIALLFLRWRDTRRQVKSVLRSSSALGRVTGGLRAPPGPARPIFMAVFFALSAAPWGFTVVPDFIALASGPDPLRTLVAATCVAVGFGGCAWAVVASVRRELRERRIGATDAAV